MVTKILSASYNGLECHIIEVESDVSNGFPGFNIVGLTDTSIQESRERVRSGIMNSGAKFPTTRKTVNLAPAQLRKQGSIFDLAIALGILSASKQIPINLFDNSLVLGELSLNGNLNKIPGVLPITQHAKTLGFSSVFLPSANAAEAAFIKGIKIIPITSLKELITIIEGKSPLPSYPNTKIFHPPQINKGIFSNIVGLEQAKRALSISAAGGHNLLITGSPGCGKTMLSKSLQDLLPPMSDHEIIETTKIFSIAGILKDKRPIITNRPFREVHHTASTTAIIGGGDRIPRPGEISLAHNGVLFLDEISEFQRHTLEALRQPLEDRFININRIEFTTKFPCAFTLIATTNPCPCGYYLDKKAQCRCTKKQIDHYQKRLSGPLLDRFDLFLRLERVNISQSLNSSLTLPKLQPLSHYQKQINKAYHIQQKRFLNYPNIYRNSDMDLPSIQKFCRLTPNVQQILSQATQRLNLSNRSYLKILRISRTIADLESSPTISSNHLTEALQYR